MARSVRLSVGRSVGRLISRSFTSILPPIGSLGILNSQCKSNVKKQILINIKCTYVHTYIVRQPKLQAYMNTY